MLKAKDPCALVRYGLISQKMKKCAEIVTFDDLVDIVDRSGKHVKPVCMSVSDFYEFKPANRARNTKCVSLPLLADLVEIRFVKGSKLLLYRRSFDEETYEGVDFLVRGYCEKRMPPKHEKARGISNKKKSEIVKLLGHVPAAKTKFYLDLDVNNDAKDLVSCNELIAD